MALLQTRDAKKRPSSYRLLAMIWLVLSLMLAVITILLWMFSEAPSMNADINNAPLEESNSEVPALALGQNIDSLDELTHNVPPIDFETVIRDLRDYPKEFVDSRYLKKRKDKWTVQVMNVEQNSIITDYLKQRKDRDKFAYFRFSNDEKQTRYMLTYGVMSSPQEALGAAKLVDFNLPKNIRVIPESFKRYLSVVDKYERTDKVINLDRNRPRNIKLQPTKHQIPVKAETSQPKPTKSTSAEASADNIPNVNQTRTNTIRELAKTNAEQSQSKQLPALPSDETITENDMADNGIDTASNVEKSSSIQANTTTTSATKPATNTAKSNQDNKPAKTQKPQTKPANNNTDSKANKVADNKKSTPKSTSKPAQSKNSGSIKIEEPISTPDKKQPEQIRRVPQKFVAPETPAKEAPKPKEEKVRQPKPFVKQEASNFAEQNPSE